MKPKGKRCARRSTAAVGALTPAEIRILQSRELTPEDYELLMRLDEGIKPPGCMAVTEAAALLRLEPVHVNSGTECAICLGELGAGEVLACLPCEHAFHETCITKWLTERRAACPMCNCATR